MDSSAPGGPCRRYATRTGSTPGCADSSSTRASTSLRKQHHRAIEVEITEIGGPSIADIAPAIVDRELVDEALRHLDPEWRAVVVMHYFLGMPLPEVAGTLGIPLGTAKSRLHRSLVAMRVAVGVDEPEMASSIPGGQLA